MIPWGCDGGSADSLVVQLWPLRAKNATASSRTLAFVEREPCLQAAEVKHRREEYYIVRPIEEHATVRYQPALMLTCVRLPANRRYFFAGRNAVKLQY